MPNHASWKLLVILTVLTAMAGCAKDRPTQLMGRWYSNDVSMRFRKNGTVLYNSRNTGLVEGRYEYDASLTSGAQAKPQQNLTIWLPQPGRILVLEFDMRFLGNDRIQMKPIVDERGRSELGALMAGTGMVLKRAADDGQDSNALNETPPLVSATPNNPDNPNSVEPNPN